MGLILGSASIDTPMSFLKTRNARQPSIVTLFCKKWRECIKKEGIVSTLMIINVYH